MIELAEVFRRYGDAYLQAFGDTLLPSHRRALRDIRDCRTEILGGQVFHCDQCGHERYAYHSCRNRACPKCHTNDTSTWLRARREELLPVKYFHVTFTLPAPLREIVRSHQRILYGILMKAAARSLIRLAADPRYVGGEIGILTVLHTWGRTLVYHPHVHCLVPAGGVSADRRDWLPARKNFLVPVRALSKIFQGMFREGAAKALPDVRFPKTAWRVKWVVNIQSSTVHGPDRILDYLGRYVHRVALTNRRILSIDSDQVSFRYQDTGDSRWKTMTLPAFELIRRFLQHVLPRGVHKVRYFGLWAPSNRKRLKQIQLALLLSPGVHPGDLTPLPKTVHPEPLRGQKCPQCGKGVLILVRILPRHRTSPSSGPDQYRGPP